jgi:hypothetical protein
MMMPNDHTTADAGIPRQLAIQQAWPRAAACVRQLLECASPLALSREAAVQVEYSTPAPRDFTPPKAAEDRRTPRREAVSNLPEDCRALWQAVQPPNMRQLLECASPLALSREETGENHKSRSLGLASAPLAWPSKTDNGIVVPDEVTLSGNTFDASLDLM